MSPGIEEEETGAVTADRERPSVAADRDRAQEIGIPAHDADRAGDPEEILEQVDAALRRVVDRNRLAAEQEREVEVVLDERPRAEALREPRRFGVARLAALDQREDPACRSGDEQRRDAGQQDAKATVRAPGLPGLLLRRIPALGHEIALELVQLQRVIGAPVERSGEARPAIELSRVAPSRPPLGRRLRDV